MLPSSFCMRCKKESSKDDDSCSLLGPLPNKGKAGLSLSAKQQRISTHVNATIVHMTKTVGKPTKLLRFCRLESMM